MRCPSCGFMSFPHLTECKKCGKPLKSAASGLVAPAPATSASAPPGPAPAAKTTAAAHGPRLMEDPGTQTLVMTMPPGPVAADRPVAPSFSPSPPPVGPGPASGRFEIIGSGESPDRPAGFWIRVAATLVDAVVQTVLIAIVIAAAVFSITVARLGTSRGDLENAFLAAAALAVRQPARAGIAVGAAPHVGHEVDLPVERRGDAAVDDRRRLGLPVAGIEE